MPKKAKTKKPQARYRKKSNFEFLSVPFIAGIVMVFAIVGIIYFINFSN